jgi:hypothetical protein
MAKGWGAAAAVVGVDGRGDTVTEWSGAKPEADRVEASKVVEPGGAITFCEGMRFSTIEMPEEGAIIRVRPITKTDAMKLARLDEAAFATANENALSFFERELQIGELPRARLAPGARLVVGERITWRDIRWYVVEYMSDGDGVVA